MVDPLQAKFEVFTEDLCRIFGGVRAMPWPCESIRVRVDSGDRRPGRDCVLCALVP